MKKQHILLAVAVTAIWGLNFSVIKIGLESVDPLILAGIRFALCAVPAVFFLKRPQVPWRYITGYGLVFGVGLWGVVNLGIKAGLSSGIASLVLQFSAFLTILLGAVVFREKLSRFQYAGIAVALTGLFSVTFVTDGTVTLTGIALVLFGAVAWSVANILMKKAAPKETLAFLVWSSLFSPLPLFALDLTVNGTGGYTALPHQIGWTAIASLLFQAYPNTVLGYAVWNWLLREYPVSTVAPLSLLVPVFGVLSSMLIFNEPLPPLKLLAGALIVTGLIIGLYGKRLTGNRNGTPAAATAGSGARTGDGASDGAGANTGPGAGDSASAVARTGGGAGDDAGAGAGARTGGGAVAGDGAPTGGGAGDGSGDGARTGDGESAGDEAGAGARTGDGARTRAGAGAGIGARAKNGTGTGAGESPSDEASAGARPGDRAGVDTDTPSGTGASTPSGGGAGARTGDGARDSGGNGTGDSGGDGTGDGGDGTQLQSAGRR